MLSPSHSRQLCFRAIDLIIPFHITDMLRQLRSRFEPSELAARMHPVAGAAPPALSAREASRESIDWFWTRILRAGGADAADRDVLADDAIFDNVAAYNRNIENLIGTVKVPLGMVGPLRIAGLNALGDFHVPLATTEAALVAS